MKKLIYFFIFLLIAVGIGFLIQQDSGYILIAYKKTTIETSLWMGILIVLVVFFVLYVLLRLFKQTTLIGSRLHHWSAERKERKTRSLTDKGLCELAEGEWQKAEHDLIDAVKHNNAPLINYLAAAQAADAQQAYERRNEYLRMAHQTTKGSEIAVGLTQAMLQINSKQWEQALATLQHIQQIAPHHRYILKLLKRVYCELKDWQQLNTLMPILKKRKVYNDEKLTLIQRKVYLGLMQHTAAHHDLANLQAIWNDMPRRWQHDTDIVAHYSTILIKCQQDDDAAHIIEHALKREWSAELVTNFGLAKTSDPTKQLATAEKWLPNHQHEFELLLCLSRLSLRAKFFGKAQQYIDECLQIKHSKAAERVQLAVHLALGDKDAALKCVNLDDLT